jgi:hypothetical protein
MKYWSFHARKFYKISSLLTPKLHYFWNQCKKNFAFLEILCLHDLDLLTPNIKHCLVCWYGKWFSCTARQHDNLCIPASTSRNHVTQTSIPQQTTTGCHNFYWHLAHNSTKFNILVPTIDKLHGFWQDLLNMNFMWNIINHFALWKI